MPKRSILALAGLALATACQTPPATNPTYLQVFYEGPQWLSGQRVLSYSPAFRGKKEVVVQEPDSMRGISPNALLMGPTAPATQVGYASVATEKGLLVPDRTGKLHLQTTAEAQQAQARELAKFNRGLNLVNARADLGRSALATALNETAADGWEVIHMTAWGDRGGLVYLLRHR